MLWALATASGWSSPGTGAPATLRATGLDLVPIPLDDRGIAPSAEDWTNPPRLIFTSPSSQYPPASHRLRRLRRLHLLYAFDQPFDDALLASRALAQGVILRPLSLDYLDQTARGRPPASE